jgi:predicted ATPase/DNA-binding SARP family transcriptional activator
VSDETNHPPREDALQQGGEAGSLVAFPRARPPRHPTDNLPLERTSFVGRERELAEVERLLGGNARLVTLCGPGGSGKTRLALAVAGEVAEGFEGGTWWVELAPVSDPELVPGTVAQAVGAREAPELSPTGSLVEHLKSKKTLLILDNCEHLVETCADLADALLGACPELEILASSREPLRVAGETNFMVPSLTLPDLRSLPPSGELEAYEAVRLFVERARSRLPAFDVTAENAPAVADVCRKLDGIPLAIELAAARTRALSVEQISERLEDPLGLLTTGDRTAAARHRTLRATFEWSYELLSETERALFRWLSVFVGGFTLEAAEAVGEGMGAGGVLDQLSGLVDKSLVVTETEAGGALRYRMLEPVRQFALELLEEGGEAGETRGRHAAFFADLAEEAYPQLRAAPQVEWLETLEQENGNLRAALSWALSSDDIPTAARLGWALWLFWWTRNHQTEGRRWMEMILPRRDDLLPWLRIRATIAALVMAYGQGDGEAAERYAEELMELSREVGGDALADSYAHVSLGLVAMARGDLEAAAEHLEEALPLFHEAGEDAMVPATHVWIGTVLLLQGDHEEARRRFEEGLALSWSIGDRMTIPVALLNLAQLALAGGDHDAAFSRFVEGIAPSEELGDRWNVAHILEGLGIVAGTRGEAGRAARLLGASEALIDAIGLRGRTYYQFDRSFYQRINAEVRATLGEAAFEAALAEGRAMPYERAIEYALEEPPTPHEEEHIHPGGTWLSAPREAAHTPITAEAEVRVFALGPARVEKEGLPIDSPDWIHKPRELLYYLLSHPEGRTKEQIGLALWPEASMAQLRSSFHDTLYRLRRALGAKEWVSFRKGRYSFERSLPYSYDVESFEESLTETRRVRDQAPEIAIRHLKEAAELYGGDYLEDFADGEWAFARQEELRRSYQEALLLLGGLLLAEDRHAEAAKAYRRAISHDRFLEEAHRGLMRSQAAMGERGRALRHYEELVGLLGDELGASPAPETSALYEGLREGRSAE